VLYCWHINIARTIFHSVLPRLQAGNGAALAAAGVGFPSPAPVVPCTSTVNIIPWGVPSLIFGQPAGLLTPDNKTYSDVTMCCNGTINFSWTVSFTI